jgi:endonuclease-3
MKQSEAYELMKRLASRVEAPVTELKYKNPYTLLVAVVLSAQATDVSVNKATRDLFTLYDTPEQIFKLGEEGLKKYIKTIGLYNSKAKNVIALSRKLIDEHKSKVPGDRTSLEALPGVGRKTAGVVLNTIFGQPTIAVDTHIFRVSNRTGLAPGKTPDQVEEKLYTVIPAEYLRNAHHWLILFGRYVCKARSPECSTCLVSDLCDYKKNSKHK